MKRIKSITALRAHLRNGHRNFAIALGGGLVSRKHITPAADGRFDLFNGIDGSVALAQTADELLQLTNIGRFMHRGAFFCEECERDGEEPVATTS